MHQKHYAPPENGAALARCCGCGQGVRLDRAFADGVALCGDCHNKVKRQAGKGLPTAQERYGGVRRAYAELSREAEREANLMYYNFKWANRKASRSFRAAARMHDAVMAECEEKGGGHA